MWNCFAIVVEWTQNNSELGLRHRKLEGNMDRVGGSNKPDVGLRMYSVTEIFFSPLISTQSVVICYTDLQYVVFYELNEL